MRGQLEEAKARLEEANQELAKAQSMEVRDKGATETVRERPESTAGMVGLARI